MLPSGGEAAQNPAIAFLQPHRSARFCGGCATERGQAASPQGLCAVLKYLNLMACTSLPDYAENDINTVTNIALILLRDVGDVFRVIELRGFDTPNMP
ncbi:hypothetical protein [Pseudomonas sp. NPDC096950]|uniref:hypothetical protein n=1 Tax=Pseudomonas sp. NPDC096950 TaxID=3364485 RepID=UPI00383A8797